MALQARPVNRPGFIQPGVAALDAAGNRILIASAKVQAGHTTLNEIADLARQLATRPGGQRYNVTVNLGFRVTATGKEKYPKLGSFSASELTSEEFDKAIDVQIDSYLGGGLINDLYGNAEGELIGAMFLMTRVVDDGGAYDDLPDWAQKSNHCLWFALRTAFERIGVDIIKTGLPSGARKMGEIDGIKTPDGLKRLLGLNLSDPVPYDKLPFLSRYMGSLYKIELSGDIPLEHRWEDTSASPSARRIPLHFTARNGPIGHYEYASGGDEAKRLAEAAFKGDGLAQKARRLARREVVVEPGTGCAWERIQLTDDVREALIQYTRLGSTDRVRGEKGVIIVNCGEAKNQGEAKECFYTFDTACKDIDPMYKARHMPNFFQLTGSFQQALVPIMRKHLETIPQPDPLTPLEELWVKQACSGSLTYLAKEATQKSHVGISLDRNGSYAAAFESKCRIPRCAGKAMRLAVDGGEYISNTLLPTVIGSNKQFARLGLYRLSEECVAPLRSRSNPWRRFIRGPPAQGPPIYTSVEITAMLQMGFPVMLHVEDNEPNAIIYGGPGSGDTTYQTADHILGNLARELHRYKFSRDTTMRKTVAKKMMAAAWGTLIQKEERTVRLCADGKITGRIVSFEVHEDGAIARVSACATGRFYRSDWARVGCFVRCIALADTGRWFKNLCDQGSKIIRVCTDSAVFIGDMVPEPAKVDIDPYKLGAWKVEKSGRVLYKNLNSATWATI